MSYDANSIEARKGALGEKIVENELKRHHGNPRRPADTFQSGASIVDFVGTDGDGKDFFAEVKTQIARPYGVEQAPCYSFPKSRINAYIEYGKKHGAPIDMFIIDPSTGLGYLSMLAALERETVIDGRKYPFDKNIDSLGGKFHFWHRAQFNNTFAIPLDELIELRKLFNLDEVTGKDKSKLNLDCLNEKQKSGQTLTALESRQLLKALPYTNPCSDLISDKIFGEDDSADNNNEKREKTEWSESPLLSAKSLVEKLAAFLNVGKVDLAQAMLDLRQAKFDREQAQMKELLI